MKHAIPVLVLAFLAGCSKPAEAPAKPPTRTYRVTTIAAEARPLTYLVHATGTVEAYEVVTVPARVEGVIEKLDFEEGKEVTTEKVLCVIDGEKYGLERDQAEAQANGAAAMLMDAEATLKRRKELRQQDASFVSEEEISNQEAIVKQARAARDEMQAKLAMAEKRVRDSSVRSPISGAVQMKHVASGQYLKVGEKIATLVDARRLRVRFRVGEKESVHLKPDSRITFTVAAFPKREFLAKLVHVRTEADPITRMVEVLADVQDADPALKPGFFATVRVEIGRSEKAVVVPEEAILPTEKGFVVFLADGPKAKACTVTLGLHTDGGSIEVLTGLAEGQTIVLQGARMLQDGVPIEVVAPATPKE
ncbi:MAG: efflux RND transporter periplasmic adaptor subunit [Planctomycetota bacterium]